MKERRVKKMIKKMYFVNYGPDSYHIIHTKAFNLLRKAKSFIAISKPGAYKLSSQEFDEPWSLGKNEKILAQEGEC